MTVRTDTLIAPGTVHGRRTPTSSVASSVASSVTSTTSCRCGQQLDCCARHHCPRCGRTLPES